ncbi:MAG: LacI family DNA-binding transcriptional regulator [bacterium]
MKNITIKDVAREAGVSPSTVSRVLSDSERISSKTKKKVRRIMRELGYHQNFIARSLVTQKTNSIALVMARPTQEAFDNPFFSMVIQGISKIAQKKHYSLVLSSTSNYLEEQEETLKLIRNHKVDGIILMASRDNDKLIKELKEMNFPFVLIGRSPEYKDIPIVNNDNIKAAFNMTKYLIKHKYEKILAISGPEEYIVSQDRIKGFQKALAGKNNIKKSEIILTRDFTYQEGYRIVKGLFENEKKLYQAIFAFDDLLALGALRAVQEFQLKVPEEIAIVGFNDDPIASYLKPSLSTVKVPIIKMGEKAAEMLIMIINKDDYNGEEIILETELILRESLC